MYFLQVTFYRTLDTQCSTHQSQLSAAIVGLGGKEVGRRVATGYGDYGMLQKSVGGVQPCGFFTVYFKGMKKQ